MMQAVESPDTRALHALKCIVLSPEDTEVKVECFKFATVDSAGMPHARSPESNRAPWVTCFKLEEDSDDQPIRQVGSWTDVLGPHTQEEPFLINYIHPDNQLPCHDPVLITGPPCVYVIAFNGTDKCIGKMTAHLHRVLKYIDMQALLPVTRLEGQLLGCRKPTVFILLGNNGGQQDLKGVLQRETRKYRQINIRITEELPLNRANLHASTLELRMEYLGYLSVFAEQEAVSFGELNKKIQNEPSLLNALNTCHKLGFVYFKIPRDMETNDAIVFTQPRCLYDLLRPVAMYQQHKSEDGCSVFQLLNHCNADRPKIEQNAFGNLLADMGIAMKTNYGEHIIIATLEDHNAPVELRYCMDPLLVACKSSPGGCYMPDGLFWGVAHELSKKWEMKVYTPSYFQYHKRGAAIVIHVTSREHFLEIGIQQGEMNRTYLTDAEPLPQQLHKVCTEVRQTVTKELFEVTHQLRGDSRICDAPVDQCDCDNHKNFRKHFPVGFRCPYHPNCLMQMQCHRDTGLCLECGDFRDAKTTYKQEIWFMPPKPTVQVGLSSAFANSILCSQKCLSGIKFCSFGRNLQTLHLLKFLTCAIEA